MFLERWKNPDKAGPEQEFGMQVNFLSTPSCRFNQILLEHFQCPHSHLTLQSSPSSCQTAIIVRILFLQVCVTPRDAINIIMEVRA